MYLGKGGPHKLRRFPTMLLVGFLFIVLASASPVSATTDPGGETLSGSRSCPPENKSRSSLLRMVPELSISGHDLGAERYIARGL